MSFGFRAKDPTVTLPGSGKLPARDMQELWFATRRQPWTSLAVLPCHAGGSALRIAEALKEVSGVMGRAARVVQAEGMGLGEIAQLVSQIEPEGTHAPAGPERMLGERSSAAKQASDAAGRAGELTIVSAEPVTVNPFVLPLVLATSAVLLVIEEGVTDLAAARHTVELVGADRILGCVLVRSP